MQETAKNKIIHVGKRSLQGGMITYLLLREEPEGFTWYEEKKPGEEEKTGLTAKTSEEALRLAHRQWKNDFFKTLACGWRYTLPERDEHGYNALFHQMVASYNASNGIYFDSELGHTCFVDFASTEARDLWKRLASEKRL